MMKTIALSALALAVTAGGAAAMDCRTDPAEFATAAEAQAREFTRTQRHFQVVELRQKATELCQAGRTAEAEFYLDKARAIAGVLPDDLPKVIVEE